MTSAQNSAFTVNTNDLKTVKLNLLINQDSEPLDLTGATVRLAVKKPDQNTVLQDATIIDALAGSCEIVLDTQAYVIPGTYTAEVMVFYGVDTVAVTSSFTYKAIRGIMSDDTLESSNEWPALNQAIEATEILKDSVQGINDKKYSYSYYSDGSVQTITEKDSTDIVISTTTFTYKTNGDVDTSVKVVDGQTVTTQYIYDVNGNLTDTINTIS